MKRKVLITGLGAITALGEGAGALWQAALLGRSGIDFIPVRKEFSNGAGEAWKPIGAVIRDFDPEKFIVQKKAIKVMARDIQLAVAAASLAMDDAGVKNLTTDRERFGVIVGSGVLNHELDELAASVKNSLGTDGKLDLKKFGEEGMPALFPLWLLKYLPNMPACHVSILFDLQGPNNTITTGASSGLQAVGEAFRIIERGSADLMLAGAAESKLNPVGLAQYEILGVLAHFLGSDPSKAYRPFNADSNGFVIGEGSGFLVLEESEHAKRRGAKIYAELGGFGSSSRSGQVIAMKAALDEAQISPKELHYLEASGLGIPQEDDAEARAIEKVFNDESPELFVTASKPVTGFVGFSAGVLDLIISSLALFHGAIPPTLNFSHPRRSWEFNIVKSAPLRKKMQYAMTNAFGFSGQCASVVTRRHPGAAS